MNQRVQLRSGNKISIYRPFTFGVSTPARQVSAYTNRRQEKTPFPRRQLVNISGLSNPAKIDYRAYTTALVPRFVRNVTSGRVIR